MSAPSSLCLLDFHEEDLTGLQRLLAEGYGVGEARSAYRHRVVIAQHDIVTVNGMEPSHYFSTFLAHGGGATQDDDARSSVRNHR